MCWLTRSANTSCPATICSIVFMMFSRPGGMYGRAYRIYCGNERSRISSTRLRTLIVSGEGMEDERGRVGEGESGRFYINNCSLAALANSKMREGRMP